jgi:PKD repeat protein
MDRIKLGLGILLLALLCAGCGRQAQPTDTSDTDTTLAAALAELEALPVPAGADPRLWTQLKRGLAASLERSGAVRFAAALPGGDSATVSDLAAVDTGGALELRWTYRNKGDYNQDGLVSINDLTPLGANLGKNTADPDWTTQAVVADGNTDGLITINDLTPIGAGFNARVEGYRIEGTTSPSVEASWTTVAEVPFIVGAKPPGSPLKSFTHTLSMPTGPTSYRVRPLGAGAAGPASNVVQAGSAVQAPVIADVTPQAGVAATAVTFTAVVTGAAPLTYAWSFGGGAEPNTSAETAPTVTLAGPGSYAASLTVTNGGGSDVFDFVLLVNAPDAPPDVVSVEPTTGVPGAEVVFGATVTGGVAEGYSWDFGGGATPNTSSLQSPAVTLGAAGTYPASVTVSNSFGAETFPFDLVVTDLVSPVIEEVQPDGGLTGTQVQYTVTNTGGTPDTWSWDFGGGASPGTSSEASPTVTLGPPGLYFGSVLASNAAGSSELSFVLSVSGTSAPVIRGVNWNGSGTGMTVEFSADISGSAPDVFTWDFGGGATPNTSADAMPEVVLGAVGTYQCTLDVSNAGGSHNYDFELVVDNSSGSPPQIIVVNPTVGNAGDIVTFVPLWQGGTPDTWEWDFGGAAAPGTSSDEQPTVTLSSAGVYYITVTATNGAGADTYEYDFEIF